MATRQRETVEQKGWRLFTSGAVRRDGTVFTISGDHGEYAVRFGHCNCPAYSRCSHQVAAEYAAGEAVPVGTVEVAAERLAELLRAEIDLEMAHADKRVSIKRAEQKRAEQKIHDENNGELLGMFA